MQFFVHYFRQENGCNKAPDLSNADTTVSSSGNINRPQNGVRSSNCAPGRSQSLFKSSVTTREGSNQPPAPPHRSFASDVGGLPTISSRFSCNSQPLEYKNR